MGNGHDCICWELLATISCELTELVINAGVFAYNLFVSAELAYKLWLKVLLAGLL